MSPEAALAPWTIGKLADAVFSVVAAFLNEDTGRFVAEVEAVEL